MALADDALEAIPLRKRAAPRQKVVVVVCAELLDDALLDRRRLLYLHGACGWLADNGDCGLLADNGDRWSNPVVGKGLLCLDGGTAKMTIAVFCTDCWLTPVSVREGNCSCVASFFGTLKAVWWLSGLGQPRRPEPVRSRRNPTTTSKQRARKLLEN